MEACRYITLSFFSVSIIMLTPEMGKLSDLVILGLVLILISWISFYFDYGHHQIINCCIQAEGIFRIAAENSQEEYVREQLNGGVVPEGVDVHCLAGLIKV
jgi:hypothetical protein